MADVNDLLQLFDREPDRVTLLERFLAWEDARVVEVRERADRGALAEWEVLRENGLLSYDGLEPDELGVAKRWLDDLVWSQILELVSKSRTHRSYCLVDRELVRRALAAWAEPAPVEEDAPAPGDLFSYIVGHDQQKRVLTLAIAAPRPVHALLLGEIGTAKTMFLEELRRLPRALYADGGMTTKAGLVSALLEQRPQYLLIDQVDHLPQQDQQALVGVMATGRVARLRHRQHEDEIRHVWVFATANTSRRLSEAFLDRCQVLTFRGYTDAEFERVCQQFLVHREGADPELARYVAAQLAPRTHSVRAAQRVARLAGSVPEVDELLRMLAFPEESERRVGQRARR